MASCHHIEIQITQPFSRSPTLAGEGNTDHKFIRIGTEENGNVHCLKDLPGRKTGSSSPCGLEQLRLKTRAAEDLFHDRVPEEVWTSENTGNSDRCRTANVYVDGPSVTRVEYDVPATTGDVKPTSSTGACSTADKCSIICERCGECRCERCGGGVDLQLPGVWCGARCGYCTPSRAVDVISCVCCVRAVLYHCSADDDIRKPDNHDDDDIDGCPCSCSGSRSRCRQRWACLAALSGVGCLPCLLLYWPLRALLAAGQAAYNATSRRRGCRCDHATNKGRHLLADFEFTST